MKKNFINIREQRKIFINMNETEISAIFDITADPINNVYLTNTRESIEELQRIVKIFTIAKSQRDTFSSIKARGLVAFRMMVSNN